jgi:hypothetical protein
MLPDQLRALLFKESCLKRYTAKKEEMPVMEQKPGRYWGVIGRQHLPLGKREDREVSASQAVKLPPSLKQRRTRWRVMRR